MGCRSCTESRMGIDDLALIWAEAHLRPVTSIRRCRVERIKRKNRNALAERLAGAIALFSTINAVETGMPPLKWFRRFWLRK